MQQKKKKKSLIDKEKIKFHKALPKNKLESKGESGELEKGVREIFWNDFLTFLSPCEQHDELRVPRINF